MASVNFRFVGAELRKDNSGCCSLRRTLAKENVPRVRPSGWKVTWISYHMRNDPKTWDTTKD